MKLRVYRDLKPKHRYQSSDFWITLLKKGYHPKTGSHKPTISVANYNEYLLEAQLVRGKFELDGWSYPVMEWRLIGRNHHDIYDTITCVYELILGTTAIAVHKHKILKHDIEKLLGVGGAKIKNRYQVEKYLARLIKKRVLFDGVHHEIVISAPYYHADAIKYNLQSEEVIEFNHMLYLVSEWEEIPINTALKKDGTPYFCKNKYIKIRFKAPGYKTPCDIKPSVLDEMFKHVRL